MGETSIRIDILYIRVEFSGVGELDGVGVYGRVSGGEFYVDFEG